MWHRLVAIFNNPELSAVTLSFFFVGNTSPHKWRKIQILREFWDTLYYIRTMCRGSLHDRRERDGTRQINPETKATGWGLFAQSS